MKIGKKYGKIILPIMIGLIVLIGASYAWLTLTINGSKSQVIKIGTLSLVLDDTMGEGITINETVPMYDTVGLTLVPYTFTLTNEGTVDSFYTVYLDDVALESGEVKLPDGVIKYNIAKDGTSLTTALLSSTGVNPNRVLDTGTIAPKTTYTYTLRLWLDENMTNVDMNKVFRGKIRVVAEQKKASARDYLLTYNTLAQVEDDDGTSYYFANGGNNLVKFGAYKQDYYQGIATVPYTSLASCSSSESGCKSQLKYNTGTEMYWRIIRINGDGTIRMIYSGTDPRADQDSLNIGYTQYNSPCYDKKYAGYTYDSGVASRAKTEMDSWYNQSLSASVYDERVALGRFCSDSTGTNDGTLKCPTMTETFGGNYQLKAGMITASEARLVGVNTLQATKQPYWTMSPVPNYTGGPAQVYAIEANGNLASHDADRFLVQARPVINLKADTVLVGSGTIDNPYIVKTK